MKPLYPLALLGTLSIALLCFGQSFGEFPELIQQPPPASPTLTASWNPSPGASFYRVYLYLNGTTLLKHFDTTNTTITFPVSGGFEYGVSVQGVSTVHYSAGIHGVPSAMQTVVARLPDNAPQLLVLPPDWFVMCQCSNGGLLLSTTNLINWMTNGLLPTNLPALFQGPMGAGQFFRSVEH